MNVDFTIRQVVDSKDLRLLREFLHLHDFNYPFYHDWVDGVCIPEIERRYKTAIVVLYGGLIVGDLVWQPHKELPRTVEGKNLRIDSRVSGRGLAYFLFKQCEAENRNDFDSILVDIPNDQKDIKLFLLRYGFNTLYQAPIYSDNRMETIMAKKFKST